MIVDARDYAPEDRPEALRVAMSGMWATDFTLARPPAQATYRARFDTVGPLTVARTRSNGLALSLNPSEAVVDHTPSIALQFHEGAPSRLVQNGRRELITDGAGVINDLTRPYRFGWMGEGVSSAITVDLDHVALPLQRVRNATELPLLETPLGRLILAHVRHVVANIDSLAADPASAEVLARTTTDLFRALIGLGSGDDRARAQTWHETELSRILEYVRQRLTERDLKPADVAAAHFISERHLSRLCRRAGFSLSEWIIQQRLEGARAELADVSRAGVPVRAIAARWGFASAAHFSRRFRGEYGLSPVEWRRLHDPAPGAGARAPGSR